MVLTWHFNDSQWWALSAIGDGEDSFVWRIDVSRQGCFIIELTDQELQDGCGDIPESFGSLRLAQEFCERNERAAIAAYYPYFKEAADE